VAKSHKRVCLGWVPNKFLCKKCLNDMLQCRLRGLTSESYRIYTCSLILSLNLSGVQAPESPPPLDLTISGSFKYILNYINVVVKTFKKLELETETLIKIN